MKRPLAALTLALLLALVVTTVVGGVAFGAIVGSRYQAEKMTESSGSISVVPDPDGTGPAGRNLQWASGAGVAAMASFSGTKSINVPANSPVDQMQVFTRQASGGTAVFAIYVDGTAAANKVGTFSPPAGSVWGTSTVNLSPAIQPGPHTLYIGPNATFSNNAFIDWFELHNTGAAQPIDSDGDGVADSTDNCVTVSNANQANNDGDAQGDACDSDDDNDGRPDATDYAPFDPNVQDPPPADSDGDGVADATDNCVNVSNPGQQNNDGDAQGDACDSDDDNDGRPDSSDYAPFDPNVQDPPSGTVTRFETEDFTRSNTTFITIQNLSTASGGQTLHWENSATTAHTAEEPFSGSASKIEVYAHSLSGTADLAVVVDGAVVGTINDISSAGWATYTVNVNVGAGSHTLLLRPANNLSSSDGMPTDYVEITGSGGTPPADADGDGVPDSSDNCPNVSNPGQADADGDGIGDACDTPAGDTQDPTTTINSGPAAGSTDTDGNVSFTYSGTDDVGVTGFDTRLVGTGSPEPNFTATTNTTKSYNSLPNGSYTFEVRAKDAAGNQDATPATWQFNVNVSAPTGNVPISGIGTMPAAPITSASGCDHRIQRGTNDNTTVTGSGTASDPWVGRDAIKNLDGAAGSGEILCIDGGAVYDVNGPITGNGVNDAGEYNWAESAGGTSSNRLYIMSTPGTGRAEVVGTIRLLGSYSTIRDLKIDGSGGASQPTKSNQGRMNTAAALILMGSNTEAINNEVYYSRQTSPAEDALPEAPNLGVGMKVGGASAANNTLVLGNWIHNCGAPGVLYDPGNDGTWTGHGDNRCVYYDWADNGQFTQNLIHDAAEQGISIYSETSGSVIHNNVIVRNEYGGINYNVAGATNTIRNNVVTHNLNGSNIAVKSGSGSVTNNCTYLSNGSSGLSAGGASSSGNITANPNYPRAVPPNTLAGWFDNADDYTIGNATTCEAALSVTQTQSPNP